MPGLLQKRGREKWSKEQTKNGHPLPRFIWSEANFILLNDQIWQSYLRSSERTTYATTSML